MSAKVVSLRLDEELLAWATEYAGSRSVSRTAVIEQALRSFREDCGSGVPAIGQAAAQPSTPTSVRSLVDRHPGLQVASSLVRRDPDAMARQAKLNAAKGRAS